MSIPPNMSSSWLSDLQSQRDPRVASWPLMDTRLMALTVVAYLVSLWLLVRLTRMRDEPLVAAPVLKGVVVVHNLVLLALSAYMCVEVIRQALIANYSFFGNSIDMTDKGLPMAKALWLFYLSKIIEFGDTYIMAIKKNYHQISFLHVYHHSSIFVIWWVTVRFAPGGDAYFSAALNALVHVFMYAYYLWATFAGKPKGPKPTWKEPAYYKQFITTGQMGQFCLMLFQSIYDIVYPPLRFPRFCCWMLFFYMFTMLALFANFYYQTYSEAGTKRTGERHGSASSLKGAKTQQQESSDTQTPPQKKKKAKTKKDQQPQKEQTKKSQ